MFIVVAIVVTALAHGGAGMDAQPSLALGLLAGFGWLAFAGVFWPFVPCPAWGCDKGKVRRPGKRAAFRPCWWCGGSGTRTRWFRRAFEAYRRPRRRS